MAKVKVLDMKFEGHGQCHENQKKLITNVTHHKKCTYPTSNGSKLMVKVKVFRNVA